MAELKISAFITSFLTVSTILAGFLVALLPGNIGPAQAADENCQVFPETGFTVCGRFLEYWKANGGLARQGFPISGVFEEVNSPPPAGDGKLHKVQYFQRARFEDHPENTGSFEVLLGLLGTEQFSAAYPTIPAPLEQSGPCQFFKETGQQVCGRFLEYWQANGGLAQLGYPISGLFNEQNQPPPAGDGKIHRVQYFQRARFEEHLENKSPSDVLLGLLGAEQYLKKYPSTQPPPTQVPPDTTLPPAPYPPGQAGPLPAVGCLPATDGAKKTMVEACTNTITLPQPGDITVYGRLVIEGIPANAAKMETNWTYKTLTGTCSGTTGGDGVASCTFRIGNASKGSILEINIKFNYNGQVYTTTIGITT